MQANFGFELLAPGAGFFLLDQWSKNVISRRSAEVALGSGSLLHIQPKFHVEQFYRRDRSRILLVVAWFVALISAITLHRSGAWFQSPVAVCGLGLAFGGAGGNLVDILFRRHVVNFIDFRWWPAFNLADVGIIGGLALAFWTRS